MKNLPDVYTVNSLDLSFTFKFNQWFDQILPEIEKMSLAYCTYFYAYK